MHVILSEKIEVNGRHLYCKIISATPTLEHRPYLLCIPGGPGFGHLTPEMTIKRILALSEERHALMPNIILFDPLGCGDSDKAENIPEECSMTNFTENAVRLVEKIKQRFCPHQRMDLRVYGGSFGSMTAMDIPMHRPAWLQEDADIQLRQIISVVGPNGAGEYAYARNYLDTHFKEHADYDNIKKALNKLLDGKIQSKDDYIESIVFKLAPLYSESNEKLLNSWIGRLIKSFYHQVIPVMKGVQFLANKLTFSTPTLDFMIEGLTGCSVDVLNQFFSTHHSGFNLFENIQNNLALYQRVPIFLVSCNRDHMVDYKTAQQVNVLLPGNSAVVILNDKHMTSKGPNRAVFDALIQGVICEGSVSNVALRHQAVASYVVTEDFNHQLELLTKPMLVPLDSTARSLQRLEAGAGYSSASTRSTAQVVNVESENIPDSLLEPIEPTSALRL